MNAVPAPRDTPEPPSPSGALGEFLKRKPRLLVNGEGVEAHGRTRIAVSDPSVHGDLAIREAP